MTAIENITSKRLKIKIGSKQLGPSFGSKPCDLSQGLVMGSEYRHSMSRCSTTEMVQSHDLVISSSGYNKLHSADSLKIKFSSTGSNKRDLFVVGDVQKAKRRKMDRSVTQHCAMILKQLMVHPAGWVFNQPVDPVKLQIPDYLDIISNPMDLGTVKTKLNKNEYSSVDEFAADVRLTFSNAMVYNPPSNNVHCMAKELNDLFDSEFYPLGTKSGGRCKTMQPRQIVSEIEKCTDSSGKKDNRKTVPTSVPGKHISAAEKQKLREQFLELLRGKIPSHLQGFLRKIGLDLQMGERMEEDVDAFDDDIFWEFKRIISSSLETQPTKVTPAKESEHVTQQAPLKITRKGTDDGGNGSASGFAIDIPLSELGTSVCGSCHSMRCKCDKQKNHAHSSIDMSSEGSRDYLDVSRRECGIKIQPDLHSSKSERESERAGSALNEKCTSSSPQLSTTDTTTSSGEGCGPLVDVQLSPKKALRAAMLKSRFADTILKAKQKALLDKAADPVKLQQEKERLERQQKEERARIEAQIKASEEAAQLRAEAERKMQREREREAARLALQRMVKTVEIDNDHLILKDLELLSGCSISGICYGSCDCEGSPEVLSTEKSPHFGKALEQLGLFMKDDDDMEDEDANAAVVLSGGGDEEEGEITP